MEKLDSKLESGNSALIAQVFSQLVLNAKAKNSAKLEFAYFKSKCLCDNSLISDIGRLSIVQLIQHNLVQVDQVLADCVTNISTVSNITSLAKLIANILHLPLLQKTGSPTRSNKSSATRPFQMSQHPLIKILQEDHRAEVQMCIFNEIVQSCHLHPGAHDLYEPVYLYCICSPLQKIELGLLRHKFWIFFMKYDDDNQTRWIFKLSCWLQIEDKNAEQAGSLLDEVFQKHLLKPAKQIDHLIFTQILVIRNMVAHNEDCRLVIKTLLVLLPKVSFCHSNAALLILSKAVLVCSPVYLDHLLTLCLYFANQKVCKPESYLALKSVLLHWLATSNLLTENAINIAKEILKLHDHVCRKRPLILASRLSINKFHYLLFSNPEMFLAVQLAIKADCTKGSKLSSFVTSFQEAPMHFHRTNFTFLCGLLLNSKLNTHDQLKVLSMIVACSLHYQELLPTVMSLLLYKLSNTEDIKLHFQLLKALPLMAKLKDNVPKVIATIQAISKQGAALNNLALRLLYDTWEIDNVAYSALEEVVHSSVVFTEQFLERDISRAFVFRKLSERRPEVHGKELVAHLSKILNDCTTTEGAVPTALAIEGIQFLCQAEIIDIVTTWKTLSPKFKLDKRVPVVKSLCGLISEIPHLEYAQSYDKLNDDVVEHLWYYVAKSEHEEVQSAAFHALSAFSLEAICLHIPPEYLDENNSKERTVMEGKIWVKFLSKHKWKAAARQFLTKLVANEVDNYLKYVYQLKSRREPENYVGLPTHSIVRALTDFLKHHLLKVKNWDDPTNEQLFTDCLKILCTKYSKPLPPLDWSFLLEVIHIESLKSYCLDLASHQSVLSGSARRLVETYIIAVTETPQFESAIHVYRNLLHIANSIQPVTLKQFFQNSLHSLEDNRQFEVVLAHLKEVLEEQDVQEVNKNTIEEVLTEIVFAADATSQRFFLLLNCVASFSQKSLTKIAEFGSHQLSQKEFEKIVKIRCHISKNSRAVAPLDWLNDIFGTAYQNNIELKVYVEDVTSVLNQRVNHEDSPFWLNDRFGEIQAKVADNCEVRETEQLCDILAIAAVYFSGLYILLPSGDVNSIKYFFPGALATLLDEPTWSCSTAQILEWIHYMSSSESISEDYRHIFGWTLACLRHHEEFSKSSRWVKYLDCKIYTQSE